MGLQSFGRYPPVYSSMTLRLAGQSSIGRVLVATSAGTTMWVRSMRRGVDTGEIAVAGEHLLQTEDETALVAVCLHQGIDYSSIRIDY